MQAPVASSISLLVVLALTGVGCSESSPGPGAGGGAGGSSSTAGSAGASASGGTNSNAGTSSTGGSAGSGSGGTSNGGTSSGGTSTAGTSSAGTTSNGGSGGTGVVGDRGTPEGTCARWNADRADRSEGTWSGDLASCDPGDISADGRANALRQYNLYRWLADLPAVDTSPEFNALAQACALLQSNWRDNGLSHEPPESWDCWTEDGYEGSNTSNISGGRGVSSVDAYMVDGSGQNGPEDAGHRRWILSNGLGPIGLGSTDSASCMKNIGGNGQANKAWLAWPPPGIFPYEAYAPGNNSYDDAGWSIQSEDIDLEGAQVTVTEGGVELAIEFRQLGSTYGNARAIGFKPDGWQAEAGKTYSVSVGGVSPAIAYDVTIVACEP